MRNSHISGEGVWVVRDQERENLPFTVYLLVPFECSPCAHFISPKSSWELYHFIGQREVRGKANYFHDSFFSLSDPPAHGLNHHIYNNRPKPELRSSEPSDECHTYLLDHSLGITTWRPRGHPNGAGPHLQCWSSTCVLGKVANDTHSVALPSGKGGNHSKSCFPPSVSNLPPLPSGSVGLPRDAALVETFQKHRQKPQPATLLLFACPPSSLLVHCLPSRTGIPMKRGTTSVSSTAKFLVLIAGSESRGCTPIAWAKSCGQPLTLLFQSCPIHPSFPPAPKPSTSLHPRSNCPNPELSAFPNDAHTPSQDSLLGPSDTNVGMEYGKWQSCHVTHR